MIFVLEQLILLAQEPVTFAPGDRANVMRGAPATQFWDSNSNRKVCGEWFQRMRPVLLQILNRYGSASACYALTQARLVDALHAADGRSNSVLSEQALQALLRKKQEGQCRRETVLSTISPVVSDLGHECKGHFFLRTLNKPCMIHPALKELLGCWRGAHDY